ncbi:MAG: amidohydrolase family protein [Gammaproteobacteria bacterium]
MNTPAAFRPISADSHVTEPRNCYIDYIDPAFRARAPRIVREQDGGDSFAIDGMPGTVPVSIISAAGLDPRKITMSGRKIEEIHPGGYDPRARLADQDRDGVAAEIIYPSVGMVLCNHPEPAYKNACFQAYNRWLQEFCAAAPGRLFGMGQTAVTSVAEAIEDLRRIKEMGFAGVMMPGEPCTEQDYYDPIFDPLWKAAVELGLPLSFHILTSRRGNTKTLNGVHAEDVSRGVLGTHGAIRPNQDIIGNFIWGRVFERHPDLRIVCVEADAGWAPHFMYRMDHAYKRLRYMLRIGDMARLPSEYFHDNVYLTFQDDWVAFRMLDMCNPRRLLWANDFPHSDSTWPGSQELLAEHTAGMGEREKRWILADNVTELYRLNVH